VTYARETWSTTKEDDRKLAVRERKILRNVFGPVYESDLRVYEKRHNEQSSCLCRKPSILTCVQGKRLERLGRARRSNGGILKNVSTEQMDKNRPLGRPRPRRKDTAEKDTRLVDGIDATTDRASDRESTERLARVLDGPLSC